MCLTAIRILAKISSFACTFVIMTGIATVDAGPLNTPRSAATATKLQNGKVLVAGGADGAGNILSSAEVFDPATNAFVVTGTLTVPRVNHTATLMSDGRVFFSGGADQSGAILASTEIYNPATGVFTASCTLQHARRRHVAILLANGNVLIAGGYGTSGSAYLKSAELFNPLTGTCSTTGDMTIGRSQFAGVLLGSGKAFVCGGVGGDDGISAGKRTEQYDPATGEWSTLGDMISARGGHITILLTSGRVFISGGKSSELFDPSAGTFTTVPGNIPPKGTQRGFHGAARLLNGDVFVYGGALMNEAYGWEATQYRYSESGNSYTSLEPNVPNAGRVGCPVVLLDNGKVLIVGGKSAGNPALGTAILYDPSNDTFSIP